MTTPDNDFYFDDESNVKVVPRGERSEAIYVDQNVEALQPDRTPQQKAQDDILDRAEEAAKIALAGAEEAIGWLEIVTPVKAATSPVYLRQLLAEINEVRRIRQ